MSNTERSAPQPDAVGIPVERRVRPWKWAVREPGGAGMWAGRESSAEARITADEWDSDGFESEVVPLYDQAALDAAVAAERDCRTCAHHTYASGGCVSALRCVGGDRYKPTQPRQLWEQRPPKPAPF